MLWAWWGGMLALGFVLGAIASATKGVGRVFMKTLALVLAAIVVRLVLPGLHPDRTSPLYFFLDFILLTLAALGGDYLFGLLLGRSDKGGYREEAVGH